MPVLIDKLNNIWARVVWQGRDPSESTFANPLSYLDNNFAIYVPNFQFSKRFKERKVTRYDGKFHLFKKEYGVLPIGLVKEAYSLLKESGFKVRVTDNIKSSFKNPEYDENKVLDFINRIRTDLLSKVGYVPYDYQETALIRAIRTKRALFESPTGSGKSLTLYLIIRCLIEMHPDDEFKLLISVPSRSLVTQMYRDFKDYGWDEVDKYVGQYSSDFSIKERNESLGKKILLSVNDSIDNLLSKDKEFCNRYSAVFVDEAHKAKEPEESKRLMRILQACENASYRIAMTGTIPKNKLFEKNLEGAFGKKEILTETKDLQDLGILSNCEIFKVEIPYELSSVKFLKTNKVSYVDEVELTRLNKSKLHSISYLINQGYIKPNENTLILCNKIENGEFMDIVDHIRQNHKEFTVEMINGSIKGKERDKIITSMNSREGVIIVATYNTMSTGVNIKKLHNCIFASSIKSYESVIQSIGRVLRTHISKSGAKIFDLVDELKVMKRTGEYWRSYVNTQWKTRESYYIEKKFKISKIEIPEIFSVLNIEYELSK